MLTPKEKRELEEFFNVYSFNKEYNSEWKAEYNFKMFALKDAVKILGYKFVFNEMKKDFGIEYSSYRLEEINE